MLYYSIRSRPSGAPAPPLTGQSLELELPDQPYDDRLLGQIDSVESGEVQGWACLRGALTDPLKVSASAAHASKAGQAAGWHVQACRVCLGPWEAVTLVRLHAGQRLRVVTACRHTTGPSVLHRPVQRLRVLTCPPAHNRSTNLSDVCARHCTGMLRPCALCTRC